MIRFFITRILFPLIVLFVIRSVIATIAKTFSQAFRVPAQQERPQTAGVPSGGELKKDPVCGTYVSTGAAVTRQVNGELIHFCSRECRDKYLAT